jgi:hypothetical protein
VLFSLIPDAPDEEARGRRTGPRREYLHVAGRPAGAPVGFARIQATSSSFGCCLRLDLPQRGHHRVYVLFFAGKKEKATYVFQIPTT